MRLGVLQAISCADLHENTVVNVLKLALCHQILDEAIFFLFHRLDHQRTALSLRLHQSSATLTRSEVADRPRLDEFALCLRACIEVGQRALAASVVLLLRRDPCALGLLLLGLLFLLLDLRLLVLVLLLLAHLCVLGLLLGALLLDTRVC